MYLYTCLYMYVCMHVCYVHINTLRDSLKAKQTVSRIGSYWGQSAEMHKEPHFNAQKFNKRMLPTPQRRAQATGGVWAHFNCF